MLTAEPDPSIPAALLKAYRSKSMRRHRAALRRLQVLQQAKLGARARRCRAPVRVMRDDGISALAWLGVVGREGCELTVGAGVEVGPLGAFEGVWDGDFAKRRFDRSQYFFGSGVAWSRYAPWDRRVTFVPPKHCWEFLYILTDREAERTFVSNSMSFAFAAAGIDTGSAFFAAVEDRLLPSTNTASTLGADLYEPLVAETPRYAFRRMMFHNFRVDFAGGVTLVPGPAPETPFANYADYRAFLVDKIRRIRMNATDPGRLQTYPPITPVSRGYDSPCVAVLARDAGCEDALTLDLTVKGRPDSGTDLARRLGLAVKTVTHVLGADVRRLAVAFEGERREAALEFVASPGLGDDVAFLSFEAGLRGRTFLIGAMGDSVWRRNSSLPPGLPVRVAYGKSITEFRLRTGFALVPVPAIGARFPARVKRITKSEEMAAYTLRTPYDRPFPRRVVEEAGIPRGDFATAKSAASPTPRNRAALFRTAVEAMMARYRPTPGQPSGGDVAR